MPPRDQRPQATPAGSAPLRREGEREEQPCPGRAGAASATRSCWSPASPAPASRSRCTRSRTPGFFCVDNLPPELLREFLRLETQRADRAHRASRSTCAAPARCRTCCRCSSSCATKASACRRSSSTRRTDALVRRFSETRRAHPLADRGALVEAIELERQLLAELRELSTVIDTSQLRPAQLRAWMRDLVRRRRQPPHAGVRELRVQARRAARRRLRVRHPRAAQPALRARAAPAHRPRRRRSRAYLEAQPEVVEMLAQIEAFLRALAARLRGRPAQLPDGRDRLHRRPAPLGLVRRAARRGVRARAASRWSATASSTPRLT